MALAGVIVAVEGWGLSLSHFIILLQLTSAGKHNGAHRFRAPYLCCQMTHVGIICLLEGWSSMRDGCSFSDFCRNWSHQSRR